MVHDAPWEGSGCGYHTVFRDGDRFRMYYIAADLTSADGTKLASRPVYACYAESRDGNPVDEARSRAGRVPGLEAEQHRLDGPGRSITSPSSRTRTPRAGRARRTRPWRRGRAGCGPTGRRTACAGRRWGRSRSSPGGRSTPRTSYVIEDNWKGPTRLRRHTLRIDGFVALKCALERGRSRHEAPDLHRQGAHDQRLHLGRRQPARGAPGRVGPAPEGPRPGRLRRGLRGFPRACRDVERLSGSVCDVGASRPAPIRDERRGSLLASIPLNGPCGGKSEFASMKRRAG